MFDEVLDQVAGEPEPLLKHRILEGAKEGVDLEGSINVNGNQYFFELPPGRKSQ